MKNYFFLKYEIEKFKKIITEKEIKNWTDKVLKELSLKNSSFSLLFNTKKSMIKLNEKYFKINHPTDVISFSQIEGEKIDYINSKFLGDIVICIPEAINYARAKNHPVKNEIFLLILHGILHLLGYDHVTDNGQMTKLQNSIFLKLTGENIE